MIGLIKYSLKNKIIKNLHHICSSSALVDKNRNEISEKFLASDSQYLLMIDSDMTFEVSYLDKMIQMSKEFPDAVVSGLAFMGHPPSFPIAFMREEDKYKPISKWPDGCFEVDILGTYGMLIPRHILEKLGDKPFSRMGDLAEDFSFCIRAKEAGFKFIIDPEIKMGHMRARAVTYEDFERTVLPLSQAQAKDRLSKNFPKKPPSYPKLDDSEPPAGSSSKDSSHSSHSLSHPSKD